MTERLHFSLFTFHFPALEKEMATHLSVLAWRTPGMGEPGGLPYEDLDRLCASDKVLLTDDQLDSVAGGAGAAVKVTKKVIK